MRCRGPRREERCTALYEIATGTVSYVPESQEPDPDRPGARPICRVLRAKVLRLEEPQDERAFGYNEGLLAEALQVGEADPTQIRIDRCHGRSTLLHTRPFPTDMEFGGGVFTWTALGVPLEPVGDAEKLARTHGTIELYRLSNGERRSWTLPRLRITRSGLEHGASLGVDGYSAHTAYDVFWVGAQTRTCGIAGCQTESSYVYAAPL
jgi:hypothetical protein